jgi:hypothetical protein
MKIILVCTAVGFVIGVVFFAKVFSQRIKWERGVFLAFLVNIPNLILLSYLMGPGYGTDPYAVMILGAVEGFGIGGFGLGAIAGMIFVTVRAHGVKGP